MFGEGSSIRRRRLWSSGAAVNGYRLARAAAERLGLQVVLKTYYSPIPDLAHLPAGVWEQRDPLRPQFTDHCFTGDYPTALTDRNDEAAPPRQLSLLAEAG